MGQYVTNFPPSQGHFSRSPALIGPSSPCHRILPMLTYERPGVYILLRLYYLPIVHCDLLMVQ